MENGYTRRISLEEDFMNYSSDDLLYGALQYLATYHPTLKKLYLTKKNLTKHKKELYILCGLDAKKLKRHLDKLKEKNLIKEEMVLINDTEYASYTFPYDYDGLYQLVNNEMLWYIVSTRSQQAVRVYITLLNWYQWKSKDDDTFSFTNKDIMQKLGYSTNSNNTLVSSAITNILESFKREGVINYEEVYEEKILNTGETVPTPKKKLLFVASSKSEMK